MRQFLILVAGIFAFSTATQASTLSIGPPSFNATEGDTINFSLDVDLTDPSNGGRFFIVFDPAVLQFDAFTLTASNPWNDGGGLDVANAIAGAGTIDVRLSAGFDTITGSYNIGSFSLIAQAPTSSTMVGLSVDGVPPTSQWGASGTPISIDFSGSTGSIAAIPLPAVAYLFPAGLIAGLGWMRRLGKK